jgi:hypothetical protein
MTTVRILPAIKPAIEKTRATCIGLSADVAHV